MAHTVVYRSESGVVFDDRLSILQFVEPEKVLWVDIIHPDDDDRSLLTSYCGAVFQPQSQTEEIESSSRFVDMEEQVIMNSHFLYQSDEEYHAFGVNFIIRNNILITTRFTELRSFSEVQHRIRLNPRPYHTGFHIAVALFELRVDFDADLLESIVRRTSKAARSITADRNLQDESLLNIVRLQEMTMRITESVIDKERVVLSMLRSEWFPPDCNARLQILLKDIESLRQHAEFNFNRLEYLQDSLLGLINLDQNRIIKIFSVLAIIFMPPTLIASAYGMNFRFMPELEWIFGYPFALFLMIGSSVLTYLVFRLRRWL